MYATLPLRRLIAILLWPFGLILVALIYCHNFPETPAAWLKLIGIAISYSAIALLALAGSGSRFSPWRLLWQACPPLNRWFFPDLNGEWQGTTSSNWPVLKSMLDAATAKGGLKAAELEAIDLKCDDIVINISASLFHFRLNAKLANSRGSSHSLTARVTKNELRDIFELQYLYSQDTPEAGLMDDSSHLGAATLEIDLKLWELNGYYWTRRKWRSGLSTAGKLNLRRARR